MKMARYSYNNYSLFRTQLGDRYQFNGKLVSANTVPADVKENLNLLAMAGQEVPAVEPDVKEKLVSESVEVKPELKAQEIQEAPVEEKPVEKPVEKSIEKPIETPELTTEFSEFSEFSIYHAPIELLAQALYERFGVYTAALGQAPKENDKNPLTLEVFSRYYFGISYQAYNKVMATGGVKNYQLGELTEIQARMDSVPVTQAQHVQQNSFESRTALRPQIIGGGSGTVSRQVTDTLSDDLIAEPQMGRQVIRPDW